MFAGCRDQGPFKGAAAVLPVYPLEDVKVEPPKEMMKNTLINLGNQCSKGIPKKRSEKSKKKQSAALKKRRSV